MSNVSPGTGPVPPASEFSGAAGRTPPSPFGWIVDGANAFGSLLIFAIMVLILADVASRNLANKPIHGVAEMVGMSVIVVVFSQLASTVRHNRMARADIFIDGFRQRNPRAGAALTALWSVMGVIACGVILYATWPLLAKAWTGNEFVGTVGLFTFPEWPLRAAIVTGAGLTLLQYVALIVTDLRIALSGARQAADGRVAS